MPVIHFVITLCLVTLSIGSHTYPSCFVISTEKSHYTPSHTSVVRNTREHLTRLKETGKNIYGAFEAQPVLFEYQLPPKEQQLLPRGFTDNFRSVSYLWHMLHSPSVTYFHNKLDALLEYAASNEQANIMRAQMQRWGMYTYLEFREFLQDLLVYNQYILRIAHEIATNALLKESIARACSDAPGYIAQEAQRIADLQQREAQKAQIMQSYRNQCDTVNTIFESQRSELAALLPVWEKEHPKRITAYHKTLEPLTGRTRYTQHHSYTISRDANAFLHTHNLNPQKYVYGSGNAFQHELMQEIIAGIEHSATITLPSQMHNPFAHHIMYHTAHAFDDARATNAMGDCVSSIKLIDIAHTFLDYCKKIGSGAINITLGSMNYGIHIGKGIFYTTRDAFIHNANYILHPIDSIGRILQFPFALGELINAYVPLIPETDIATPEEWDTYFQQLLIAKENCRQLKANIKEWWQTTPSEQILQQATYVIAGIPINAFITARMISFTIDTLRYSRSLAMRAALQAIGKLKARKIPRLSGPIGIDVGYIDVEAMPVLPSENNLYMLQPVPTSPATPIIPLNIIASAALIGISEATITKALENFIKIPDLEGCPRVIERCFKELSHLPGFAHIMKRTSTKCSVGSISRGKGDCNELRSALVLKDKGHNVLEFGKDKIKNYTPDIITDQYLVECKNWSFEHLAKNPTLLKAKTEQLFDQLSRALEAALTVNKKVLFMSKKPIPLDLAEKVRAMGVEILEG